MRVSRLFAVLGTLALFVLHNDWWNWAPSDTLVFGRWPLDLVYHLLWVAVSSLLLWFILRVWWGPAE